MWLELYIKVSPLEASVKVYYFLEMSKSKGQCYFNFFAFFHAQDFFIANNFSVKNKICTWLQKISVITLPPVTCWSGPTASRPWYMMDTHPSLEDRTNKDMSAWPRLSKLYLWLTHLFPLSLISKHWLLFLIMCESGPSQ